MNIEQLALLYKGRESKGLVVSKINIFNMEIEDLKNKPLPILFIRV